MPWTFGKLRASNLLEIRSRLSSSWDRSQEQIPSCYHDRSVRDWEQALESSGEIEETKEKATGQDKAE
jgi:hypothetical protein